MIVKAKKINAFADSDIGGNPAGLVLNSPHLTPEQMTFVTRTLKVSETAFVFPSKKADIKNVFLHLMLKLSYVDMQQLQLFIQWQS